MTARTILAAIVIVTVGLGDGAQADVLRGDFWKDWPSGRNPNRFVQWHTSAPNRAGEKVLGSEKGSSSSTTENRTTSNSSSSRPVSTPTTSTNSTSSTSNRNSNSNSSGQPVTESRLNSNVLMEGGSSSSSTTSTTSLASGTASTSSAPAERVDAYINLGAGQYPSTSRLAAGDPQPWYSSSVVTQFFNGQEPDSAARAQFTQNVLNRVEQTYLQSGLDISLTTDPNVSAAHTLSVVSDSYYPGNSRAIGVADLKGDGFTFIDEFTPAKTLDTLAWAVAKNVAHELMHTFGGDHYDTTGRYLDAGVLSWDVLLKPEVTVFSPKSVAELASLDFQDRSDFSILGLQGADEHVQHCQCGHPGHYYNGTTALMQQTVPEPTTVALWTVGAVGLIVVGHRRRQQSQR